MKIHLFPQRRDDALFVVRSGSSLIVNGETFDFSPMADGSTLPAAALSSSWFFGQVDNIGGELAFSLILPLPVNYSQAQAFPACPTGRWPYRSRCPAMNRLESKSQACRGQGVSTGPS